jgi:hypothetical protein
VPAKYKVSGGPETIAAFEGLRQDIASMPDAHDAVARARIPGVRSRTPVRSGDLASSWDAAGDSHGGAITSRLVYAGPIEYGWLEHNIAAQRMVRDTLEAEQKDVADGYGVEIEKRAKQRGFDLV